MEGHAVEFTNNTKQKYNTLTQERASEMWSSNELIQPYFYFFNEQCP